MTKAQTLIKKEKEPNMEVKDSSVAQKIFKKSKVNTNNKTGIIHKNKQNGSIAHGSLTSISKNKNNKLKSVNKNFDSENDNGSFEDSDESNENNITKNKGIKMFKGLRTVINDSDENKNKNEDNSEVNKKQDDTDDEENDSDDKEDEAEDCSVSLKVLLGDSIVDDEDDEDFDENDETDDDEEISDDDYEETTLNDSKDKINDVINNKKLGEESDNVDKDDVDEDSDDFDEEEEDDSEDNDLGLEALLDQSLIDDDDDDDFKGDIDEDNDDDDDISDEIDEDEIEIEKIEEASNKKKNFNISKQLTEEEQAEIDARTIFVGNVPNETSIKTIQQFFRSCGEIENVRIRGVVPEDSRMSFKAATITKKMHPKVKSMYAFVVFKDIVSAKEALKLNGQKIGNNTLRVDVLKVKNEERDKKKSVFIGNLPFDITDDEVRTHFTSCGNIESIRVVRDRKSGLSKGIGYVNFLKEDSVGLALELNDTLLKNCKLRVKTYCPNIKGQKRKHKDNKHENNYKKKFKDNKSRNTSEVTKKKINKNKILQEEIKKEKTNRNKSSASRKVENMDISFEGQKANIKNKFKINKMDKKKKIMAEKLITKNLKKGMTK